MFVYIQNIYNNHYPCTTWHTLYHSAKGTFISYQARETLGRYGNKRWQWFEQKRANYDKDNVDPKGRQRLKWKKMIPNGWPTEAAKARGSYRRYGDDGDWEYKNEEKIDDGQMLRYRTGYDAADMLNYMYNQWGINIGRPEENRGWEGLRMYQFRAYDPDEGKIFIIGWTYVWYPSKMWEQVDVNYVYRGDSK